MAWPVEYVPADFASVVIGLGHDLTCAESKKEIEHGRKILRQLRRRKAGVSIPIMARWHRALRSYKKHCRR